MLQQCTDHSWAWQDKPSLLSWNLYILQFQEALHLNHMAASAANARLVQCLHFVLRICVWILSAMYSGSGSLTCLRVVILGALCFVLNRIIKQWWDMLGRLLCPGLVHLVHSVMLKQKNCDFAQFNTFLVLVFCGTPSENKGIPRVFLLIVGAFIQWVSISPKNGPNRPDLIMFGYIKQKELLPWLLHIILISWRVGFISIIQRKGKEPVKINDSLCYK